MKKYDTLLNNTYVQLIYELILAILQLVDSEYVV